MPYYTGKIRLGKIILGAIFTLEDLGKISKKEEDLKNFIQSVEEKSNQIYVDIFDKLGLKQHIQEELDKKYNIDAWNYIENDINLSTLDKISNYINFIVEEMEKVKFNGSITASKKEKITDALFSAQNLAKDLINENLQEKIFKANPQVEQKIKKSTDSNGSSIGCGTLILILAILIILLFISAK